VLPPGQLRGVVRSLPGGKPVAGAKVSLTLKNSQVEPTATDATGREP